MNHTASKLRKKKRSAASTGYKSTRASRLGATPPKPVIWALDNIERIADSLDFREGILSSAESLCGALEDELLELEWAHSAAVGTLNRDAESEDKLRGILAHAPEYGYPDSIPATEDSTRRDEIHSPTYSFVGAAAFADLFAAAALIAVDDRDWRSLCDQIASLFERAEWVEEFQAAALKFETDGDSTEFARLGRLYANEWNVVEYELPSAPEKLERDELESSFSHSASSRARPARRQRPPRHGKRPGRRPPKRHGRKRPPRSRGSRERRNCARRMQHLAAALRAWADANKPTRPIVWADNITSISPSRACVGQQITIQGSGFGTSQPSDVLLMLATADGCREIAVAAANWTDTQITITVPAWARYGCVGFFSVSAEAEHRAYLDGLDAQRRRMQNALVGCGVRRSPTKARRWKRPCPPCTGLNLFLGGVPEIHRFTADNRNDIVVEPDATVILSLRVRNADTIVIQHVSGAGPALNVNVAGAPDIIYSVSLTYALNADTDDVYRIIATNPCGTVQSDVRIHVRRRTNVAIRGIEVIQVIQNFTIDDPGSSNDVFLVAGKRAVVRVYVDSGLPDTYNAGGLLPVQATLETEPLSGQGFGVVAIGTIAGSTATSAKPIANVDRLTLTDTFNFEPALSRSTGQVRFRVRLSSPDPYAQWYPVEGSTAAEFLGGAGQLNLVVLRVDDQVRGGLTTSAEVNAALKDIRAMYPIRNDGLVQWSTGGDDIVRTNRDYNDEDSWDDLLDDIEEVAEEFEDNGEIWCGAVTAGAQSGSGTIGMGIMGAFWWYSKASWLSGVTATPAHEVGHALGHEHSEHRTGIVGLHVPDRVVKDTQRPDMMAQVKTFGDSDRWPSLGRYILLDYSLGGVLNLF